MDIENSRGIITKSIAGFYYVDVNNTIYECKARGIFRNDNIKPLVGDFVTISIKEDGTNIIEKISKRKNQLIRPPIANIDNIIIVASTTKPKPNVLILDKMIAIAIYNNIEPILVISKTDLSDGSWIYEIYKQAGIKTFTFNYKVKQNVEEIKKLLINKTSAFSGNSGVGKSTLINCIYSDFNLKTAAISDKLGRGRHTTREVTLLKIQEGGYVADTPGFSSVDISKYGFIEEKQLQYCFREFMPYLGKCKFTSCSHTGEKDCEIIKALNENKICKSRYENYVKMYEEYKNSNTPN